MQARSRVLGVCTGQRDGMTPLRTEPEAVRRPCDHLVQSLLRRVRRRWMLGVAKAGTGPSAEWTGQRRGPESCPIRPEGSGNLTFHTGLPPPHLQRPPDSCPGGEAAVSRPVPAFRLALPRRCVWSQFSVFIVTEWGWGDVGRGPGGGPELLGPGKPAPLAGVLGTAARAGVVPEAAMTSPQRAPSWQRENHGLSPGPAAGRAARAACLSARPGRLLCLCSFTSALGQQSYKAIYGNEYLSLSGGGAAATY